MSICASGSPNCLCCGTADGPLKQVRPGEYRCERHIRRIPCRIAGCGRTFPGRYHETIICGRHWRQAPRAMRDEVTRLRRLANRTESPADIEAFRDAWYAVARHIEAGHDDPMDVAAIHAMFGWPYP